MEESAKCFSLKINKKKTKYIILFQLLAQKNRYRKYISFGDQSFEIIKAFTYMGLPVTNENVLEDKIKRRLVLIDIGYFKLQKSSEVPQD